MLTAIKRFLLGRRFDQAVDAVTTNNMSQIYAVGEILKSSSVKKPLVKFCVENEAVVADVAAKAQELQPAIEQVVEDIEAIMEKATPLFETLKGLDYSPLKSAFEQFVEGTQKHVEESQEELAFNFEAIFEAEEHVTEFEDMFDVDQVEEKESV